MTWYRGPPLLPRRRPSLPSRSPEGAPVDAPGLLVVILGLLAHAVLVVAVLGAQRASLERAERDLAKRRAAELRAVARSAVARCRLVEQVRARETAARGRGEPIPMRETVGSGESITVRGTVRVSGR